MLRLPTLICQGLRPPLPGIESPFMDIIAGYDDVLRLDEWKRLPPSLLDLMRRAWDAVPEARPSMKDVADELEAVLLRWAHSRGEND